MWPPYVCLNSEFVLIFGSSVIEILGMLLLKEDKGIEFIKVSSRF